jgi:hypothetical protein
MAADATFNNRYQPNMRLCNVCLLKTTQKNSNLTTSLASQSPAADIGVDRLQCHAKACVDKCHATSQRQGFAMPGYLQILTYFV